MNFIHIITSLESGGTEKNLLNFIKFGGKKNSHTVFVLKPHGFFEKDLSKSVKVFTPKSKGFLSLIKFIIFIKSFCKKYHKKIDLIQSWNYQTNLISIFIKSNKKIWQIRSSGEKIFHSPKRFVYVFLNGLFSLFTKKIIFNSYRSREQHKKFFLNKKLIVIHNGFEYKDYKKKIKKSKKINFLCVARNDYYKDHDNLIKSFLIFNRKFQNWNLYIIGKGNSNILQKYQVDDNFRKKIIILDERKNLTKYFSISHFHVLSSLGESFPNVIGETMSKGILNISTDVGDVEYLIKDKEFLVKPENSLELASALLRAKNLFLNDFDNYLKKVHEGKKLIKENFSYSNHYNLTIQELKKTQKLKYLFVLPTLNGGGAERVTTEIMKTVNDIDKNVITDLLVLGTKSKIDYDKIFKGEIFYLNHKKTFLSFFSLKNFINKNEYDIIFSNIPNVNALLNLLKFINFKKFFLISRESNMPNQPLKFKFSLKNLVNYLLRYFYFNSDLIISPSKEINFYLKKLLFFKNKDKFFHLPNFIDMKKYRYEAKKHLKIKLPKNYFINISNIQYQKNIELLLNSFKNLEHNFPNFKLIIIGKIVERDYAKKIKNLIVENNLRKKVIFLGYKKNPFYFISKSSAVLSTSRWEGMPNSILQSCSLNKRVISTDCLSGPREIKDYGFKIYLSRNNDLSDFSKILMSAIKRNHKINNNEVIKRYNNQFLMKIKKILRINAQ